MGFRFFTSWLIQPSRWATCYLVRLMAFQSLLFSSFFSYTSNRFCSFEKFPCTFFTSFSCSVYILFCSFWRFVSTLFSSFSVDFSRFTCKLHYPSTNKFSNSCIIVNATKISRLSFTIFPFTLRNWKQSCGLLTSFFNTSLKVSEVSQLTT